MQKLPDKKSKISNYVACLHYLQDQATRENYDVIAEVIQHALSDICSWSMGGTTSDTKHQPFDESYLAAFDLLVYLFQEVPKDDIEKMVSMLMNAEHYQQNRIN